MAVLPLICNDTNGGDDINNNNIGQIEVFTRS